MREPEPDRRSLTFYIPNLVVGGAEQVTVNIVNGLARRGYDVELVLSHPVGELRSAVTAEVAVTELAQSRIPIVGIGAHLPRLVSYLDDAEPTALFAQKTDASVVCLAADRLADAETTVVPTEHLAFATTPAPSVKSRVVRRLAGQLYPSADRIVAVSQGVADSLVDQLDVQRERVSVLYNPVELDTIRERARDPVEHAWVEDDDVDVVLFVGRHHPQKDLGTWLRAFARVHETAPDTRAVIAGTGERTEHLQALADRLGMTDVVSFPGYIDNPYRYMDRAGVFLLSSRFEGLPTVLVEAMACGCPVVATDCPSGPREILADGEYGQLVPVGDVTELASAVEEALEDPVDADLLCARADDFAPEVVLDEYERFLRTEIE
jgi:glycosyltransferase involved in cell wall biosynthesis